MGHVGADVWLMGVAGVQIEEQGSTMTWTRPDIKISFRSNPRAVGIALKIFREPLPRNHFPANDSVVGTLISHGFLVEGTNPAETLALSMHYHATIPLNEFRAYFPDTIKSLQERAAAKTWVPQPQCSTPLTSTGILRASGFIPVQSYYEAVSDSLVDAILSSLYDGANHKFPSAGGLYPVYVVAEQQSKDGTWHSRQTQENGSTEYLGPDLENDGSFDENLLRASTRFWVCANLSDVTFKYGSRGYRYALLEAGHVAQTLVQILNVNNIDCRPFGGFRDDVMRRRLKLPASHIVIYAIGAFPFRRSRQWIVGEQSRFARFGATTIHYFEAHGERDKRGRRTIGFAVNRDFALARTKAHAELAERIVLVEDDTFGNSNGIAAHATYDAAAAHAILELYERHCVLRAWHTMVEVRPIKFPKNEVTNVTYTLAARDHGLIRLLDIRDPKFDIPCVLAVVFSPSHGGILTASAAALSEYDASVQALYELIVDKSETEFLTRSQRQPRSISPRWTSLERLVSVATFTDLSFKSPSSLYHVVRAESDQLVPLYFGDPPNGFFQLAERIFGEPIKNARFHPIG
ncbi:YcaO-like family protein [Sulfobacillus thermotolerans]|uniref:YcaO-like family protein n=1 Tax=Sulfobacillus thermotolerans TaxID=338644 RepID=UPI003368A218